MTTACFATKTELAGPSNTSADVVPSAAPMAGDPPCTAMVNALNPLKSKLSCCKTVVLLPYAKTDTLRQQEDWKGWGRGGVGGPNEQEIQA